MNKQNLPLIIGISLPILFIVIISVIIFAPSLFIKPQHNFIYTTENGNYYDYNQGYQNTYKVEDEKIVLEPVKFDAKYAPTKISPILYLYDVKSDSSHQITFKEAQEYAVDPGPSSPDGYTVGYKYGHDGIFELFGSNNSNNGYFISKGNGSKRLNGIASDSRYNYNSGNFRLIGWIK